MSQFKSPLVSVCVPTYNRADRLRRALATMLKCTYQNIEVIISDNASPDHTEDVCREFERADPRIRYFRHAVNQGVMKNFEFARAQATGKYFLWHADDDMYDANYIELCVAELEADPSLVLVSGLALYHDENGATTFRGNVLQPASRFGLVRALLYVFFVEDNSIFYGVYRNEPLRGLYTQNMMAGDSLWVAEVLLHGRAKVLPTACNYREAPGASVSPKSLAAAFGAPVWHGTYPWIAVPLSVARGLAFGCSTFKDRTWVLQSFIFAAMFSVSFLKQCILMVMPKLPFGQRLYRKLFSSQLGA